MTVPKTTLVTGATSGLGFELCAALAGAGSRVHLHGRSPDKAEAAAAHIRKLHPGADPNPVAADLGTMAGVDGLALAMAGVELDCLVNNAGAAFGNFGLNGDAIERTCAINHFAPVRLTQALIGMVVPTGLVLTVSSASIRFIPFDADDIDVRGTFLEDGYSQLRAYALSKLLNLAAMQALARANPDKAKIVMFDPGGIQTDFAEKGGEEAFVTMTKAHWDEMDTPVAAAEKAMRLLLERSALVPGGTYFNGAAISLSALADDPAFQDRILRETLAEFEAAV